VIKTSGVLFFIFWIGLRALSDLGVNNSESSVVSEAASSIKKSRGEEGCSEVKIAVFAAADLGVLNAITRG